jgi:hypothetical protein
LTIYIAGENLSPEQSPSAFPEGALFWAPFFSIVDHVSSDAEFLAKILQVVSDIRRLASIKS